MAQALDPVLERWMALFRAPLVGLIASWGTDWSMAEEVAQDTFAEAWLGRGRLRGDPADPDVAGPWLRGIAHNLHRTRQRERARARAVPLPADVPGREPLADERLEQLRTAFARLRPEHQTVLRMFYLDETTTREVAALLDLTPKAVESRLRVARHALREHAQRLQAAEEITR